MAEGGGQRAQGKNPLVPLPGGVGGGFNKHSYENKSSQNLREEGP
jgi:hypothetical protein